LHLLLLLVCLLPPMDGSVLSLLHHLSKAVLAPAAGTLYRAYPGPWQVIRRNPATESHKVIYTSETRIDLRKVALEILPDRTL
jgi:hypothetical protein